MSRYFASKGRWSGRTEVAVAPSIAPRKKEKEMDRQQQTGLNLKHTRRWCGRNEAKNAWGLLERPKLRGRINSVVAERTATCEKGLWSEVSKTNVIILQMITVLCLHTSSRHMCDIVGHVYDLSLQERHEHIFVGTGQRHLLIHTWNVHAEVWTRTFRKRINKMSMPRSKSGWPRDHHTLRTIFKTMSRWSIQYKTCAKYNEKTLRTIL